jgi:hypothetical protein
MPRDRGYRPVTRTVQPTVSRQRADRGYRPVSAQRRAAQTRAAARDTSFTYTPPPSQGFITAPTQQEVQAAQALMQRQAQVGDWGYPYQVPGTIINGRPMAVATPPQVRYEQRNPNIVQPAANPVNSLERPRRPQISRQNGMYVPQGVLDYAENNYGASSGYGEYYPSYGYKGGGYTYAVNPWNAYKPGYAISGGSPAARMSMRTAPLMPTNRAYATQNMGARWIQYLTNWKIG